LSIRPRRLCCCLVALAAILQGTALAQTYKFNADAAGERKPCALVDGDRVVLLGSTLIEREAEHGYWEAALTSRYAGRNIQFRNLGWSGDNVFGEARARFGSVADGFAHLKEHVLALKPTVIFVSYGANESFAGQDGLASFLAGYDALLAVLDETKARIVFIAPNPHEDLGRPLPDPATHNKDLKIYCDAVATLAARRQNTLVNLYDLLGKKLRPPSPAPLTDNGMHLTAYGYWRATPVIEGALGLPARRWQIELDARDENISARGMTVSRARFAPTRIAFAALDEQLPLAPPPADAPLEVFIAEPRVMRAHNLAPGKYALRIGGVDVATGTAADWAAGRQIVGGPDVEQSEQLRKVILAKNLLYFHRWRPQNETYLFGFRKHEQGQNAVEIPQFDPLVAAKERTIRELAVPRKREYELIRLDSKQVDSK
jgi:lysophospholipase L1-like esterase